MTLKRTLALIGGVVGLFALYEAWVYSRTDWIPAGHVGVIYDAQGGLQKKVITPRAVYVGWAAAIVYIPYATTGRHLYAGSG